MSNEEIKINKNIETLVCYECNNHILVPPDFIGNKYVLLEIHYMTAHGIDLRTVVWKGKHRKVIDVINAEIERTKIKD